MIDDGCPHVVAGETLDWFAVEFSVERTFAKTTTRNKSASEVAHHKYAITAEVVYVSDTASVIDFGLKAIRTRELLPSRCKQGDFITGVVNLSLPLCTEVVPTGIRQSLAYTWHIETILADLTPKLNHVDTTGQIIGFTRDHTSLQYQEITATELLDANAYILRARIAD